MKNLLFTKLFFILFISGITLNTNSQTFDFRLFNSETRVYSLAQIEFGDYFYIPYYQTLASKSNQIMNFNNSTFDFLSKSNKTVHDYKILKINKLGNSYQIFDMNTFDADNFILRFELKTRDNYIQMYGTCQNYFTNEVSVFSIKLDQNLNVLSSKSTVLPDNRAEYLVTTFDDDPNKKYMLIYSQNPVDLIVYLSLAELDSNFSIQRFHFFDTNQFNISGNPKIVEYDTCFIISENYQTLFYRVSKNDFSKIDTINMSVGHHPISYQFFKLTDSTFLNPMVYRPWPWISQDTTMGVVLTKRNLNLAIVDSLIIFNSDTSQVSGITSLDMRTPDSLFYAGVFNSTNEYIISNHDNFLVVYNINWNTKNINWVKYYGGNGFYYCFHTLATSDGGCLISAGFHDWRASNSYDYDLFLLKLDANGQLISNIDNFKPKETISFTLFPNPTTDVIKLRFDDNQFNELTLKFSVYDLTGKKHLTSNQLVLNNELQINTSGLSFGMYFLVLEGNDNLNLKIPFIKQ